MRFARLLWYFQISLHRTTTLDVVCCASGLNAHALTIKIMSHMQTAANLPTANTTQQAWSWGAPRFLGICSLLSCARRSLMFLRSLSLSDPAAKPGLHCIALFWILVDLHGNACINAVCISITTHLETCTCMVSSQNMPGSNIEDQQPNQGMVTGEQSER